MLPLSSCCYCLPFLSSLQSPSLLPLPLPLLLPLAIALILTRHPRLHWHCPLCCHCRPSPASLVTIAITLLPSPSLLPATLITIAIALILAHHSCHRFHYLHCCCSPATLVAVAIALIVAYHPSCCCHCPLCCLCPYSPTTLVAVVPPPWGGGKDHPNPVRNPLGCHRRHRHCCYCRRLCHLCCPRDRPGGAGRMTHRLSTPGRWRSGAAVGIHGAGIILPANQQRRRQWWHHHQEHLDAPEGHKQGQLGQLLHLPAQACKGGGIVHTPRQPGQQQLQ
jgi:hypothetical protein